MRNDGAELTMSGRAATNPTISGTTGDRVSFRVVSTERRYDEASGEWIDGDEFGANVVCWRQLSAAVLQLIRKGDPVVVTGRISTRKFDRDGVTDYYTQVKADHVALDVAKVNGRIRRQEGAPSEAGADKAPTSSSAEGRSAAAEGEAATDPFQNESEPADAPELAEVG